MDILDLDFSKPIYTKLTDGIHQVKFYRAELLMLGADITQLGAKIEARIAGVEGFASTERDLRVTNDLDALLHGENEYNCCFIFHGSSLKGYIHTIGGCTDDCAKLSRRLLERYANFGYTISNFKRVCRWIWEGTEPLLFSYKTVSIPGIPDGTTGLRFNLLTRQFIEPTDERKCIGGKWYVPRYYDTEEECRKDNAIKVFTFED